MKLDKKDLLLYCVTDRHWLKGRSLAQDVESAIKGGASLIQLREKELSHEEFLAEAKEIGALCRRYGVPFIINDDVELSVLCGADGVHVGQDDMDVASVRQKIGGEKILGVSAQTVEQALKAEAQGADYLGVGAVFPTDTKKDADFVPYAVLRQICQAVSIPVVAIGGISEHNIEKLRGSGIWGVALVSAVFAADDIKAAAEKMRMLAEEALGFSERIDQ